MSAYNDYVCEVIDAAKEVMEDEYLRYAEDYDDFSDVYDALMLDDYVTGNGSGRCSSFDENMARNIIWEDEFINYVADLGTDIGDLIKRGTETIDVWARCMILDHYYSEFEEYWNELIDED